MMTLIENIRKALKEVGKEGGRAVAPCREGGGLRKVAHRLILGEKHAPRILLVLPEKNAKKRGLSRAV